jgi:hypothetical protein
MSNDKMFNILIDPADLERFGDLVGARNKGEVIRNLIKEYIQRPTSITTMKAERDDLLRQVDILNRAIDNAQIKKNEELKDVDKTKSKEDQARDMILLKAVKQPYHNQDPEEWLGALTHEDIMLISDTFEIKKTSLEAWIATQEELKIIATYLRPKEDYIRIIGYNEPYTRLKERVEEQNNRGIE